SQVVTDAQGVGRRTPGTRRDLGCMDQSVLNRSFAVGGVLRQFICSHHTLVSLGISIHKIEQLRRMPGKTIESVRVTFRMLMVILFLLCDSDRHLTERCP